jgi:type I restriction enzyme S subunit
MSGSTHKTIYMPELLALRTPLPPVERQLEIAAFLDRESVRIDELLGDLGELRRDCDELWQSKLSERLNGLEAPSRPLHTLVDQDRPVMYGIVLPGEPVDEGVLLIKGGNVERGHLSPEHLVRVAPEIEAKFARARLGSGDLLVTIRGSYGAVAEVPAESDGANITQDTARVSPAASVDGRYLLHVLRAADAQQQMQARATGAGVRGVNIRDLRRLQVPAPALDVQQAVAQELDLKRARVDDLLTCADRFLRDLGEYRDALISEAVTGQLDVAQLSEVQMDESLDAARQGERPEVLAT